MGLALVGQLAVYGQSSQILFERLESPAVSGFQTNIWPGGWGWFSSDGSKPNTDGMTSTTAHSGKQSLFFNDTNGAGYESVFLKGTGVSLTTNDQVTYSFWLHSDPARPYNGSTVFVCALEFHDTVANTTPNVAYVFASPDQVSTNGWTRFSTTASPAAPANLLMFVIKTANNSSDTYTGAGGILYFDDLQASVTYPIANASNVLSNPSFEQGGVGWTLVHPQGAGGNVFEGQNPVEDGSLVYKCWGTGVASNIQSAVQSQPTAPGYAYTANGYARNGNGGDTISAPSQFWLQVDFLDASSNILTSYESARLDSTADTFSWTSCNIVNQVNPVSRAPIGTVSSLVAPPNAVRVQFSAIYSQNTTGGGSVQFDNLSLVQVSGKIPPKIVDINPDGSMLLNDATVGFNFTALSAITNIDSSDVHLLLNGTDVSSRLTVSGGGSSQLAVSYDGLQANQQYNAVITITDKAGATASAAVNFDTFSTGNFSWEAEDYDFNGRQYINNPAPLGVVNGSYANQPGRPGVDYYESGAWGGDLTLRESYGVGPGIAVARDATRWYDLDAGSQDYLLGWFDGGITNGDWVDYTRSIPAGSYNLFCRLSSQGLGQCQVSAVTDGAGTSSQTTQVLGTATLDSLGNWAYAPVVGTNGSPIVLNYTNTSNVETFQVAATSNVSLNFFMLVPVSAKAPVWLTVGLSAGNPVISFASQASTSYTLQYKANLTDAAWSTIPGSVTGDGNIKSITDTTAAGSQRFYRVVIQ